MSLDSGPGQHLVLAASAVAAAAASSALQAAVPELAVSWALLYQQQLQPIGPSLHLV